MIVAYIPVLFILVGVLTYALSTNSKVSELGRILYFAGVLALAMGLGAYGFRVR